MPAATANHGERGKKARANGSGKACGITGGGFFRQLREDEIAYAVGQDSGDDGVDGKRIIENDDCGAACLHVNIGGKERRRERADGNKHEPSMTGATLHRQAKVGISEVGAGTREMVTLYEGHREGEKLHRP